MKQLIMVDGPDYVGKTTFINTMLSLLEEKTETRETKPKVTYTRMLGGGDFGEVLRNYLLDTDRQLDPVAAFHIVLGSNIDTLLSHVLPLFKTHDVVFLDRSFHSTLAYQTAQMVNHPTLEGKDPKVLLKENEEWINKAIQDVFRYISHHGIRYSTAILTAPDELLNQRVRLKGDRFEDSPDTQAFTRWYFNEYLGSKDGVSQALGFFSIEYANDGTDLYGGEQALLYHLLNNV